MSTEGTESDPQSETREPLHPDDPGAEPEPAKPKRKRVGGAPKGRPYKFNKTRRKQFLELLELGHSVNAACEMIGFSRSQLYKHRRNDPTLDAEITEAKNSRIELVEDSLYTTALGGNVQAQQFFLVNRTRFAKDVTEKWESLNSIKAEVTVDGGLEVREKVDEAEVRDRLLRELEEAAEAEPE